MNSTPLTNPPTDPPPKLETNTRPATDPTPILSTIGLVNAPVWGDEHTKLVMLEGQTVAWQLQWFLTGIVAALIPWTVGAPGVVWSYALFGILMVSGIVSVRYSRKRGVRRIVTVRKEMRRQVLIRSSLWLATIVVMVVGNNRALDPDDWVAPSVFAFVVGAVVLIVIVALVRRRQRIARKALAASLADKAPPTDQWAPPTV